MGDGDEMRGRLGFFGAHDQKGRRLYLAGGLGGGVVVNEDTFFERDVKGVSDFLEEFFFSVGQIAIAVGELDEVGVEEEAFGQGELLSEVTDEEGGFEGSALAEVMLDALEGFVGVCAELLEEFFEDGLLPAGEATLEGEISEDAQKAVKENSLHRCKV
jgi:hypothetical protein